MERMWAEVPAENLTAAGRDAPVRLLRGLFGEDLRAVRLIPLCERLPRIVDEVDAGEAALQGEPGQRYHLAPALLHAERFPRSGELRIEHGPDRVRLREGDDVAGLRGREDERLGGRLGDQEVDADGDPAQAQEQDGHDGDALEASLARAPLGGRSFVFLIGSLLLVDLRDGFFEDLIVALAGL